MGANIEAIADAIRRCKRFVVTAHLSPDGDAEASQLSMAHLLRLADKEAIVVNDEGPPVQYAFLPETEAIAETVPDDFEPDAVIVIDTPRHDKINCGAVREHFDDGDSAPDTLGGSSWSDITTLFVDHHGDAAGVGDHILIDSSACSASSLVYRLMRQLGVEPDVTLATQIVSGILTDTGRFCFEQTNSEAMAIGSEMIDAGVNIARLANELFFKNSYESIKLMGNAISTIEISESGRVATMALIDEPVASDGKPVEIETLPDHTVSIRGVEIGMFFRPTNDGRVRVSARSADEANVNEFAHQFGGGGHRKAAGIRVDGPIEKAREELVNAAEAYLDEHLPSKD
ncbi:MAG: DHHA1 domain-containing protein [Candidatus Latescibacteria bacterium]|jgi:phosphoesterase RecJ-like protein|nr:DHHA1 domain-containing protein [Candidatus Latescibacterota bacterium]